MWIVFIVSCIPTVRPIFVQVFNKVYTPGSRTFATGEGYEQQSDTHTPRTHARVYASHSRKGLDTVVTSLPTRNLNESAENILPGQQGIMMTSQVVVKYEGSESEHSGHKDDWKTGFDDSV
jgi:hypothetical protein